jgi:hypothetical protein
VINLCHAEEARYLAADRLYFENKPHFLVFLRNVTQIDKVRIQQQLIGFFFFFVSRGKKLQ